MRLSLQGHDFERRLGLIHRGTKAHGPGGPGTKSRTHAAFASQDRTKDDSWIDRACLFAWAAMRLAAPAPSFFILKFCPRFPCRQRSEKRCPAAPHSPGRRDAYPPLPPRPTSLRIPAVIGCSSGGKARSPKVGAIWGTSPDTDDSGGKGLLTIFPFCAC